MIVTDLTLCFRTGGMRLAELTDIRGEFVRVNVPM
jgi:hypothetical protein